MAKVVLEVGVEKKHVSNKSFAELDVELMGNELKLSLSSTSVLEFS